MAHTIMGAGGIEVDLTTGRPVVRRPEIKQAQARERFNRKVQEASQISAELHKDSEVLKVFLEQYRDRLQELAKDDLVCKALEASIKALRFKLEVAPVLAEREALRILGPQLASLIED